MNDLTSGTMKLDLKKNLARRPMLTDPEEYKLIKQIHFPKDRESVNEGLDPLESWDRMKSKAKRNQSR